MIKILELSEILAAARISSSQKEQILTTVKNLSISPPPYNVKAPFDPPFQYIEEAKESCTTFDGEQPLEPEIKEFQTWPLAYSLCIWEVNHLAIEDLHGTKKEEKQSDLKEEVT